MKELEFVKPGDIEKRSFAIIAEELAMRHITIKEEEAPITMRVIHTSADFEHDVFGKCDRNSQNTPAKRC